PGDPARQRRGHHGAGRNPWRSVPRHLERAHQHRCRLADRVGLGGARAGGRSDRPEESRCMSTLADVDRSLPAPVVRWGRADVVFLLAYLLLAVTLGYL